MMTDKLRAAAQFALETLEDVFGKNKIDVGAINMLRAALAEPKQEPMHPEIKKMYEDYFDKCFRESSAQQRPWVGLTGPEVDEAYGSVSDKEWAIGGLTDARVFFCAIEAKLKEKNT